MYGKLEGAQKRFLRPLSGLTRLVKETQTFVNRYKYQTVEDIHERKWIQHVRRIEDCFSVSSERTPWLGETKSKMERISGSRGTGLNGPTPQLFMTIYACTVLHKQMSPILTFRGPSFMIYYYNKTNEMHEFLKFVFGIELYMFRTVSLYIIRSLALHTQQ